MPYPKKKKKKEKKTFYADGTDRCVVTELTEVASTVERENEKSCQDT